MARTSSKIAKAIPSSETGSRTTCFTKPNESGDKYLITQNPLKDQYTLWKCLEDGFLEDGFEKIATSVSPLTLDNKIPYEM